MAPDIAWAVVMGRRFVGVWAGSRAEARAAAIRHLCACRLAGDRTPLTPLWLDPVPLGVAR